MRLLSFVSVSFLLVVCSQITTENDNDQVTPTTNNDTSSVSINEAILKHTLATLASDSDTSADNDISYEAYLSAADDIINTSTSTTSDTISTSQNDTSASVTETLININEGDVSLEDSIESTSSDDDVLLHDTDEKNNTTTIVPVSVTPSFWDLFKEQVQKDFDPIIRFIPQPIKVFVSRATAQLMQRFRSITLGAAGSLVTSSSKILRLLSQGLSRIADHMDAFVRPSTSTALAISVSNSDSSSSSSTSQYSDKYQEEENDEDIIYL
jgi:hypothetical protein